jgi:glycosyl transferase family 25
MNAADGQCPILLINLASSVARLEEASRSLAAEGLAFERIEAVDGRLLDATQRAALAPDNRGWFYQPLTPGEIGCFMSHLVALRAIVARGWQVAAVFEDDFSVRPGLAACLRELASEPAALPDVVKVFGARGRGERIRGLRCGGAIVRSTSPPSCTTAAVWTRRGAERFLGTFGAIRRPIDVQLKHWWEHGLDVAWVDPPPVGESSRHTPASTIGGRRTPGAMARLGRLRYRTAYAMAREARYAGVHGVGAWLRSLRSPG